MPAVRWRVFDEAGRWLAELHTPEGFELRKVQGGLLLGVTRNSYGVEEVRGYRLEAGVG